MSESIMKQEMDNLYRYLGTRNASYWDGDPNTSGTGSIGGVPWTQVAVFGCIFGEESNQGSAKAGNIRGRSERIGDTLIHLSDRLVEDRIMRVNLLAKQQELAQAHLSEVLNLFDTLETNRSGSTLLPQHLLASRLCYKLLLLQQSHLDFMTQLFIAISDRNRASDCSKCSTGVAPPGRISYVHTIDRNSSSLLQGVVFRQLFNDDHNMCRQKRSLRLLIGSIRRSNMRSHICARSSLTHHLVVGSGKIIRI